VTAKRSFGVAALEGIVFHGAAVVLGIAWVYIVARLLDVSSMGRLLVTMNVANSVLTIFSLGLPHSFAIRSRELDRITLTSNALVATLGMATVSSLALFAVGRLVPQLDAWLLAGSGLLPLLVFLMFIQTLGSWILRAAFRFRESNLIAIGLLALFNVQLIFLSLSRERATAEEVLRMYVSAAAGSAAIALVVILVRCGFRASLVSRATLRNLFLVGGHVQVGNLLKETMYKADLYLVGWLLGPAAAGAYGSMLKIIEAIARFVDAVGLVILPFVAKGSEDERRRIVYRTVSITFPVALAFAIVVSVGASLLVDLLFGEGYAMSADLLRVGIFALVPLAVWKILANDVIGRGRVRIYILSTAIGAAVILLLNLLMLRWVGLGAAPWILIVSYGLAAAVLLMLARLRFGLSLRRLFFSWSAD
jgi:O-antigen/teichoic acid export membrane protein